MFYRLEFHTTAAEGAGENIEVRRGIAFTSSAGVGTGRDDGESYSWERLDEAPRAGTVCHCSIGLSAVIGVGARAVCGTGTVMAGMVGMLAVSGAP